MMSPVRDGWWSFAGFNRRFESAGFAESLMNGTEGGPMGRHKKTERKKELDRKRKRRAESLKLRAKGSLTEEGKKTTK